MEWHSLITRRSIPSLWRRPTLRPFARTTRRAEICSPLDSVTIWRVVAGDDRTGLGVDHATLSGICARIVLTSVSYMMPCWSLGFPPRRAEAGVPDFPVDSGGAQCRVRESGLVQHADLLATDLFAAQLRRIDRMRIDQDGGDAGASQHGGGDRAGEPAAYDGNIASGASAPVSAFERTCTTAKSNKP